MDVNIVDTTLRDGEQKAGTVFGMDEKIRIAKILNDMGVKQIECGIPAMGGQEKKSVEKIAGLGLESIISSWNRMSISDIEDSMDCGVDIIHISVPSSDIQIKYKLGRSRAWVLNNIRRCIAYTIGRGFEVTVGFEDASRADINFLIELCMVVSNMGVKRIRYADTVGVLYPRRTFYIVKKIIQEVPVDIEIHAHNDFGMALANSIAAVEAGAKFVNSTIGGIGERAGNCDFVEFTAVVKEFGMYNMAADIKKFLKMEQSIKNIMNHSC